MRRRRVLAMGAAAVGFGGCMGANTEQTTPGSFDAGGGTPTATESPRPAGTTSIGGSVHGRPYRLGDDLDLLDRSGTSWMHAFLDVRKKLDDGVPPAEDPDVAALRRAREQMGVKLYVSLQWNFIGIFGEQPEMPLPAAGSERERALIEYATELLRAIDQPVELLGLGNEPVWETMDADHLGEDNSILSFTGRLKEHLLEHYTVGDPRYVLGAFNRLYSEHVRGDYREFYRRLFEMARNDDDIDGIDLHVHYATLEEAEAMLAVARRAYPHGTVTVTEFSPIWRYDRHKNDAVASFEGGEGFAERHGVPGDTTVAEYFEAAKDDRLSPREIGDFYETMPWYNVDFVDDMYRLLNRYDVEVGTFGFLVEDDVEQLDWTSDWAPFPLNCLFQPALIATDDGAHPHYLDDFRRRA